MMMVLMMQTYKMNVIWWSNKVFTYYNFVYLLWNLRKENNKYVMDPLSQWTAYSNHRRESWLAKHPLRWSYSVLIGSLSKPRRRRQRERHPTKGLMSRTMAMHVRCKSLYISLPSSAKQQREMTKFCVLYGTWTTTANISYFHLELHAAIAHLARARF